MMRALGDPIQLYAIPSDAYSVEWHAMTPDEQEAYRKRHRLPPDYAPDYGHEIKRARQELHDLSPQRVEFLRQSAQLRIGELQRLQRLKPSRKE